ncbi:MAG: hypothetical protein LAT55_04040 [Opitutales bacterium]|nr:hypothetical protein [Opitutales bacterium]
MKAGFAQEWFSPDHRLTPFGFGFRSTKFPPGNEGAEAPIGLSCTALQNEDSGNDTLLLFSLDLAILFGDLAEHLRQTIAGATDLPPQNIQLACTHTHSAPLPALDPSQGEGAKISEFLPDDDPEAIRAFTDNLTQLAVRAAHRALGLLIPVRVRYQQALTGLGYQRRVPQKPGQAPALCWNQEEFPHLSPPPSPDPWISVLLLEPLGGHEPFVLWGTGIHPVTLGKTSRLLSPDWPGATNRVLAGLLGTNRIAFFQGASGEVHPWLATGAENKDLSLMAEAMAAQIRLLVRTARPWPEKKQSLWALAEGTLPLPEGRSLPLTLLRLGPFAAPVLPLELFASLAQSWRKSWAAPLLPITLANGWQAYWPDQQAFEEGGYEVEVARRYGRKSGDGEKLVAAYDQLFAKLFS